MARSSPNADDNNQRSLPDAKFVFHDLGGKRWPRTRGLLVLGALLLFIAAVLFTQSLLLAPQLPLTGLRTLKPNISKLEKAAARTQAQRTWAKYERQTAAGQRRQQILQQQLHPRPARPGGPIRLGYYAGWDPDSVDSLLAHADKLTHVCSEWFTLTGADGTLTTENDTQLLAILNGNKNLVLMPLLTNLHGDSRLPEPVENLVHGPVATQDKFIADLRRRLVDLKAGGVVIDWELIDPAYTPELTAFLQRLATNLHEASLQLWLQVQMGDELQTFDLETLADDVDFFVALMHDQHSDTDPPGPIAGQDWIKGWLNTLAGYGDPEQWIITFGNYGYDWADGAKRANQISFADAMSRAAYAGQDAGESIAPSYNPTFSYTLAGVNHTVWFLDAITFLNQARVAYSHGFTGLGITRLGTGDPHLWNALDLVTAPELKTEDLAPLEAMKPGRQITNIGQGEIVTVDNSPEEGERRLHVETDSRVSAVYEKFPQYPSLYHQGAASDQLVALTFDDGPDAKWTPKILDILKEKNVTATFFVCGKQVESNPGLAQRIVREGHELGNHTYFHTNLAMTSDWQTRTELNATQRVIEDVTGRSTTLFRPPYNADERPNDLAELHPLVIAQDLNYLTVLESIDPEDWMVPGADVILQRVKQFRRNGSIVLLHDAGGDRRQTVEALPHIIDYLRARGDTIVPVSHLIGQTRDDVNPAVNPSSQPLARWISNVVFRSTHVIFGFLWAFLIVSTGLIVVRMAFVITLALRHKRLAASIHLPPPKAPLSVIIAAYNEDKVIAATLRAVLDTDHLGAVEVIVVDDGSSDRTSEIVAALAAADPRVRLLHQANAGKSAALSAGVAVATHELLVFLDADTHFQRNTLRELVAPFADKRVGAVSGHTRVGNLRTFISRCQALEYICGFNLDRRAYDRWNCITVAPGAISALRRTALQQVGGFRTDTLAEDTDLTLGLHRRGWKVVYAASAVAHTEAPETIRTLAKQRFRWCFGTMQCLWKHRDLLFNPRFPGLGFFSLPSIWFFQIGLVAITPLVDLILFAGLFSGNGRVILPYIVVFLLLDQLLAVLACLLEKEPLRRSWIMVPMRIIYRPLLSWIVWKSIFSALRGVLIGWGKLERTASVRVLVRA